MRSPITGEIRWTAELAVAEARGNPYAITLRQWIVETKRIMADLGY
jgi:hypothetical protein